MHKNSPILISFLKCTLTRVTEVKNNLTIATGEGGRDSGEKGFQELLTLKGT